MIGLFAKYNSCPCNMNREWDCKPPAVENNTVQTQIYTFTIQNKGWKRSQEQTLQKLKEKVHSLRNEIWHSRKTQVTGSQNVLSIFIVQSTIMIHKFVHKGENPAPTNANWCVPLAAATETGISWCTLHMLLTRSERLFIFNIKPISMSIYNQF